MFAAVSVRFQGRRARGGWGTSSDNQYSPCGTRPTAKENWFSYFQDFRYVNFLRRMCFGTGHTCERSAALGDWWAAERRVHWPRWVTKPIERPLLLLRGNHKGLTTWKGVRWGGWLDGCVALILPATSQHSRSRRKKSVRGTDGSFLGGYIIGIVCEKSQWFSIFLCLQWWKGRSVGRLDGRLRIPTVVGVQHG